MRAAVGSELNAIIWSGEDAAVCASASEIITRAKRWKRALHSRSELNVETAQTFELHVDEIN